MDVSHPASPSRRIVIALAVAAAYFASGRAGLELAYVGNSVTLVWPPTGIAFFAVWVWGAAAVPGVTIGALAVNLATAGEPTFSLIAAVGNTLPALASCWVLRRWRVADPLGDPASVARFVAVAVLAGPVFSAGIGSLGLWAGGLQDAAKLPMTALVWWAGDAMGVLVVAPALLAATRGLAPLLARGRRLETAAVAVLLGALSGGLFLGPGGPNLGPLSYLAVPVIIWVAVRLGMRATAIAILALATVAVWATATGTGPFALGSFHVSFAHLHGFLTVVSLVGLFLAASVSQARRTMERLTAAVETLTEANSELERFAYVAAHDLQEPLRVITSYTQMLERSLGDKVEASDRDYFGFVITAAQRMNALIRDLLAYSRVTGKGRPFERVAAEDLVRMALETLQESIAESRASIDVGPLPEVRGDVVQLAQLFQHLLGNAIKFHSPGAAPRIEVTAAPEPDGRWRFSIRDNGIGIHADGHDLFEIFRRQHPSGHYPGTGTGLAICRRIVQRHGGRIWYDSVPGQGATFHFTLAD
ncbi:MAG: sensor histidine kinase [Actinomycetota bacterium]